MKGLITKLQELSVGSAAIIGIVVLGFYYALSYDNGSQLQAQIESHQARISELETQKEKLDADLVRVAEYKLAVKEMGDQVQLYRKYIPDSLRSNDLLGVISREAKAAGLDVSLTGDSSQSFDPLNAEKPYESVSIRADLKGSFGQHLLFLSFLTKVDLLLTVGNFTFARQSSAVNSEGNNNLDFNVSISGYQFKDKGVSTE